MTIIFYPEERKCKILLPPVRETPGCELKYPPITISLFLLWLSRERMIFNSILHTCTLYLSVDPLLIVFEYLPYIWWFTWISKEEQRPFRQLRHRRQKIQAHSQKSVVLCIDDSWWNAIFGHNEGVKRFLEKVYFLWKVLLAWMACKVYGATTAIFVSSVA